MLNHNCKMLSWHFHRFLCISLSTADFIEIHTAVSKLEQRTRYVEYQYVHLTLKAFNTQGSFMSSTLHSGNVNTPVI